MVTTADGVFIQRFIIPDEITAAPIAVILEKVNQAVNKTCARSVLFKHFNINGRNAEVIAARKPNSKQIPCSYCFPYK